MPIEGFVIRGSVDHGPSDFIRSPEQVNLELKEFCEELAARRGRIVLEKEISTSVGSREGNYRQDNHFVVDFPEEPAEEPGIDPQRFSSTKNG